jgi:dUTP pyrophosphatase
MKMSDVLIKFKALEEEFQLPTQGTPDAAGFDMRALSQTLLAPGQRKLLPLGCSVEIPKGYEIQVRPRSGLALKQGITVLNSPGTIDADYRGPCGVILINTNDIDYTIQKGERVCQFVVAKVPSVELELVEELSNTERGEGGFGSTGKL